MRPEQLQNVFQTNMRKRRKALGISQTELAKRTGICYSQISDLERGVTNPTLATIARICESLDTTPSVMLSPIFSTIPA